MTAAPVSENSLKGRRFQQLGSQYAETEESCADTGNEKGLEIEPIAAVQNKQVTRGQK